LPSPPYYLIPTKNISAFIEWCRTQTIILSVSMPVVIILSALFFSTQQPRTTPALLVFLGEPANFSDPWQYPFSWRFKKKKKNYAGSENHSPHEV
jgi:hypothetical protein